MKTFVLRLIRQTDGYQLLPYTLAGGVVTVIVIKEVDPGSWTVS